VSYSNKFMGSVLGFVKEMEKDLDRLKERIEDAWVVEKKLKSLLAKKDEEIEKLQKENTRLKATSLADREVLKKALELIDRVEDKISLNTLVAEINVIAINSLEYGPKHDCGDTVINDTEEEVMVEPINENRISSEITNEEELKIPVYA